MPAKLVVAAEYPGSMYGSESVSNAFQTGMYTDTKCSISVRGKMKHLPVIPYIKKLYKFLKWDEIESVFGFTEDFCPLYGGREFIPELTLSYDNIMELKEHNLGLRLPLTNHYITEEWYERSRSFLDTYHQPGNSVIILKPELGKWLARDYPLYGIEMTVMRGSEPEMVDRVLEKYPWIDNVVLEQRFSTPQYNTRLSKIVNKDKVRMFANARCGLFCPNPICYVNHSQVNRQRAEIDKIIPITVDKCSRIDLPKDHYTVFDVKPMKAMGFTKYKFIPPDVPTLLNLGPGYENEIDYNPDTQGRSTDAALEFGLRHLADPGKYCDDFEKEYV